MNKSSKEVARLGLLTALALILGYLESLVPIFPALPGVKLGLSNCAVLIALYTLKRRDAFLLLILKVTLSSLLFSGASAFFYSLAGGLLAFAAMLLAKSLKDVSLPVVSLLGAFGHNAGQLFIAAVAVGLRPALACAPALLLSSIPTGLITGFIAGSALRLYKNKE